MNETTPILSQEQREQLLDDYQREHPETWYICNEVER